MTDQNKEDKPQPKKKNLLRSGMIVSASTLLSRILGLIRDVIIANLLGASLAADVFFFANRIPNFFRRLFADGAFNQAFVPILAEYNAKDHHTCKDFICLVTGTMGFVISIITILGVLGSSVIAAIFGWGWYLDSFKSDVGAEKFALASLLLKITFPYLWFVTITAIFGAVLNTNKKFAIPALSPCLLNISTIACALLLSPHLEQPAVGLAIGIFLGGLIQLLFQLPFIINLKLLGIPKFNWHLEGIVKIRKLMLPAIFGVSVDQINLLITTALASFLATGAISYLYYSERILEFPLGMFAVAISTVILPSLSRGNVADDLEKFHRTMDWGIRMVLLLGIPAMFGIIVLRELIIATIFMHGEFSTEDVTKSAASLFACCIGLLSFMLVKVLAPGFYAKQDTKTPVKYAIISVISNICFNLTLVYPLGYIGLALSTALSGTINMLLLVRGLHTKNIYQINKETIIYGFKLLIGAIAMTVAIYFLLPNLETLTSFSIVERTLWLFGLIAFGAIVYFVVSFLCGIRKADLRVNEEL